MKRPHYINPRQKKATCLDLLAQLIGLSTWVTWKLLCNRVGQWAINCILLFVALKAFSCVVSSWMNRFCPKMERGKAMRLASDSASYTQWPNSSISSQLLSDVYLFLVKSQFDWHQTPSSLQCVFQLIVKPLLCIFSGEKNVLDGKNKA